MIKSVPQFIFPGKILLLSFVVLFMLNGCKKSTFDQYYTASDPKGGYIYDKIKSNPNFSIFAAGLERANLISFVNAGGLYTVFAPTDSAFNVYFKAKNYNSISDVPVDSLFNLLSYHIVNNMWYYYDLKTRYSTISQTLYLTRSKKFVNIDVTAADTIKINGIPVIKSLRDIGADNGVIHGIGKLLTLSPNLEQILTTNPDLSTSTFYRLMKVVSKPTYDRFNSYDKNRDGKIDSVFYTTYPYLNGVYTSIEYQLSTLATSQGGDPVFTTILAPTNAVLDPVIAPALAKVSNSVTDKIAALSPSYVQALLESYFISQRSVSSAELIARPTPLTAINGAAVPTLTAGNFVRADLKASNGVIHIINVAFPQTDKFKSALGQALSDPELTTFFQALQKAGLFTTYASTAQPGTIFAPTNTAFINAGLDVTAQTLNGAPLTDLQFQNIMKDHIVASNQASTTFPNAIFGTILATTETLTFDSTGKFVTSTAGITAGVTLPAIGIGPSNVGYVYKVDQVLLPR